MEETNIFERSSIPKTYFTFSIPVVFSMIVSIIYNIADTYFIAQTQNTLLVAAVSLCAPVFTVLMALGNIFAQGGSSLTSRLLGKKMYADIRRVSSFCFYLALITGAAAEAVLLIFRTPILYMLGADADTFSFAGSYYTVFSLGAPFIVVSFIHSNLLRAEGMSRESMIGTVGGVMINIVLDPIFITGLNMGAVGAALATDIGYLGSVVYFLIVVRKKSRVLSVNPRNIPVPGGYAAQIMGIGISAALSNITQSLCVILTNKFLLSYGNDRIAAMGIALRVSSIVYLVLVGFSFGGSPLIGYCYGAGQKERLQKLFRFVFGFLSSLAVIMEVVLMILARFAMRGFLQDPTIIREGALMLRLQLVTMVFAGLILAMTIIFQSTGKTAEALILSVCRQGVIFVIVLTVTSRLFGYMGILTAQAAADAVTMVISAALFARSFRSLDNKTQKKNRKPA